jgi:hypothetical protein
MFAVDDIGETLERLGKRGAQLVGEVVRYKDAYRLCYVRGPDGLLIGLAQELSDERNTKRLSSTSRRGLLSNPLNRTAAIPIAVSAIGAGSGIAGASIVPFPEASLPTPAPEADPVVPANPPVPPVKVNPPEKEPSPGGLMASETSSATLPNSVLLSAKTMLKVPFRSPVFRSITSFAVYVSGFQAAFKPGLPVIKEPVSCEVIDKVVGVELVGVEPFPVKLKVNGIELA